MAESEKATAYFEAFKAAKRLGQQLQAMRDVIVEVASRLKDERWKEAEVDGPNPVKIKGRWPNGDPLINAITDFCRVRRDAWELHDRAPHLR
jgi:hypothetical protein